MHQKVNNKKKYKKASTLTEVLVVLGVISTTMVVAISLIVNALIEVRLNEYEDTANGIMVEAMEIVKSPNSVKISDPQLLQGGNNVEYHFSLGKDPATGENFMNWQRQTDLLNCDPTSVYYMSSTQNQKISSGLNLCLQLIIIPRGNGMYEIISKVVYDIGTDSRVNFIKGTRYGDFIVR